MREREDVNEKVIDAPTVVRLVHRLMESINERAEYLKNKSRPELLKAWLDNLFMYEPPR